MLRLKNLNYNIADTLLQHLEEYMSEDLVEALDQLSVLAKTEELKQSVPVAYKLRESIATNQEGAEVSGKLNDAVKSEQIQLAKRLQSALTLLQAIISEHTNEITSGIGDQTLQRVAEVATQLHEGLVVVIPAVHVAVQQAVIESLAQIVSEEFSIESTVMEGQVEIMTCFEEVVAEIEQEELKDQAINITIEPAALTTAKSCEILDMEGKSPLKEGTKENIIVVLEPVASTEPVHTAAAAESNKQLVKLRLPDEQLAEIIVETVPVESEEVVPTETVVSTQQKVAIDQTLSTIVSDVVEMETSIVNANEIITEDNYKAIEPTTGNFVLR